MANKRKTPVVKAVEPLLEEDLAQDDFDLLNKEEEELSESIEKLEEPVVESFIEEEKDTKDELTYDKLIDLLNQVKPDEEELVKQNELVDDSIVVNEDNLVTKIVSSGNEIVSDNTVEPTIVKDDILKFIKDFEKSITFHQMVKKHELNGFLTKLKAML